MKEFFISFFKLLLAVLLVPVVFASIVCFKDNLASYPQNYDEFFLWGASAFLLIFLFAYQFWGVFEFGQGIISGIFKFAAPADRVLVKLLSFYLIFVLVLFFFVRSVLDVSTQDHSFMFFSGFFFAMHMLLVAQQMQDEEKTPIKPSYLFWMSVVVIFNICLVTFSLDMIMDQSTFASVFRSVVNMAQGIYVDSWDVFTFNGA
jgi:hypothetical protein